MSDMITFDDRDCDLTDFEFARSWALEVGDIVRPIGDDTYGIVAITDFADNGWVWVYVIFADNHRTWWRFTRTEFVHRALVPQA